MENEKRRTEEEQLEAHSLPGTNQAGVGPEIPPDKIRDTDDAEPPKQDLDPSRPESAGRGGPRTAP